MGQAFTKPVCCVGKEDPMEPMSARRHEDHAPIEHELHGLRKGLQSLHEVVGELQDEMDRLRIENGMLQETNSGLTDENRRLLRNLESEENGRSWNSFDIVEEHYREVAHHRASIASLEKLLAEEGPAAEDAPADPDSQDDFKVQEVYTRQTTGTTEASTWGDSGATSRAELASPEDSRQGTARSPCSVPAPASSSEADSSAIQGDTISDPADEAAGLPIAASESGLNSAREKEVDLKKSVKKPFVDQDRVKLEESSSTRPLCDEEW
mmetsp:Transcript_123227/g.218283  ORF Transcript_123227/g.218283 Transcript_123227/m.218283 type:complete len:267 (+) Transcript_123227:88-888(+)